MLIGPLKPVVVKGLDAICTVHRVAAAQDRDAFIAAHSHVRAIACSDTREMIPGDLMARFPNLELVSSFGVGYDHMDVKWAAAHNVVLTNTPDVLTEEVADTALGLLLCTVREFPQAERYLRAGKWLERNYPLTKATLRNRTVGMVGMGAIGQAIARRLAAFGVPVVYHTRNPRRDVNYLHCPSLIEMARAVDILMVIVPGGPGTQNLINAEVLDALGPDGILINMARGSVVDEPALIKALAGQAHHGGGSRRLRQGARGAAGIDRHEQRGAVPASRLGVGLHPREDGSARRRQHRRLGRGQAAVNSGRGNTLAILEQGLAGTLIIKLHQCHARPRHDGTRCAC